MKKQILENLPVDACATGTTLLENVNEADLCALFFKHIDYCLAKNYPDLITIQQVPGHLEAGIVINRKLVRTNPEQLAVLGKSDVEVKIDGYTVTRLWVKDDSQLYVEAKDNARVVIDALDNAQVFISTSGNARVVVNLFEGAVERGATRTFIKRRKTYDL